MGRVLTLAPDRRLDRLFNDVLGLDAAWLRGVPHARLAAVARSEEIPPSAFAWELDRLRRFGGDGPMPPENEKVPRPSGRGWSKSVGTHRAEYGDHQAL